MTNTRLRLGVSLAALATVAFAFESRAQEALPTIEVGAQRQVQGGGQAPQGPAGGTPAAASGTGVSGDNGTSIGIGNNGEMCADGLCNDPTSYSAPVESLGTKVNTPAIETPISTKVVTQQMLQDQQAVTIDQALRNVSGVDFNGGGGTSNGYNYTNILLRGFAVQTYYRDGIRVDSFGGGIANLASISLANAENVEVLKGPAAILYGAIEPGGIINVNIKQPLDHPAYSISQQIGSYQNYRTVYDMTGPLSENKDVFYRFIGTYENDGSFRDYGYNKNFLLNPSVKWNYDNDTWIRISDQYQQVHLGQIYTQFLFYDGLLPYFPGRSDNLGVSSPYMSTQNFAELTWHHDFNKDWSIQQTVFWQSLYANFANNAPSGFCDGITIQNSTCNGISGVVQLSGQTYTGQDRQNEYVTVVDVVGHVKTDEIDHTLLFGADYYRFASRNQNMQYNQNYTVTIFGNPAQPPTPQIGPIPINAAEEYADNVGAYVQDQMKLPMGFYVLAGGRYQYINARSNGSNSYQDCFNPYPSPPLSPFTPAPCNFDTETQPGQFVAQRVTPRSALLWRPYEWVSLYGSYAESYSPNYNGLFVLGTNQPNPPSAGEQSEGGVKLDLLDHKLQAQAAYYHLTKTNVPVGIPNNFVYELLIGELRSQGVELDVQGELYPGWTLNLAYSNLDNKVTKGSPFAASYNPAPGSPGFVPRNQATLSSNYDFKDGSLKGLRLGARWDFASYFPYYPLNGLAQYQYSYATPGYGTVGIYAGYDFPYEGMTVHAQLNVDNLLDRTYFLQGGLNPTPLTGPVVGWTTNYFNNPVIGTPRFFRGQISLSF